MSTPTADVVRASLYADSLRDYLRAAWPLAEQRAFKSNWHIDAIADHLQAVSDGEIRRLIINIPPRHMKSLGVGVFWPTWEWLRRPATQFMFTSYAQRLTVRDSLKCRRIIESQGGRRVGGGLLERIGYRGLLDLLGSEWTLTADQREKIKFENTEYGYRLATSIGGMGTGEGGDILCIDDPHKADEAESELERENVIEWLDGTLSTRLNDPALSAIVLVMQRLHEADATGHLLEQGGYEHLCLPAEYEASHPFVWPGDPRTTEGELLWPEHFTRTAIDELKVRLGGYRAAGQLQQRPAPAEGFLFKRFHFRYFTEDVAENLYIMRGAEGEEDRAVGRDHVYRMTTIDPAFSEKETADYTAMCLWGVTPWMDLLLLDVERVRFDLEDLSAAIERNYELHHPNDLRIETKAYGTKVMGQLVRAGLPVLPLEADTDKIIRARSSIPRYEAHAVFHRRGAVWLPAYENELLVFPNGANDDQVDAYSYAALALPDLEMVPTKQKSIGQTETGGLVTQEL